MRQLFFYLTGLLLFVPGLNAQVAVDAGTTNPYPSATLDIRSTAISMLTPRMTESEKNSIAPVTDGLTVFQTDHVIGYYYYNGSEWIRIPDEEYTVHEIDDLTDGKTDDNGSSVFIGKKAGLNNNPEHNNQNTGIGYQALQNNTSGYQNAALGAQALLNNTGGSGNTAVGTLALSSNSKGINNTALGLAALGNNSSGTQNTSVGYQSGFENTGSGNVFIGNKAGYHFSGDNRLFIDNSDTDEPLIGGDFDTDRVDINGTVKITGGNPGTGKVLTSDSTGLASWHTLSLDDLNDVQYGNEGSSVFIGNESISSIGGYANWTTVSDKDFKKDIRENVIGLPFIMKLRPVTYHLDMNAIAESIRIPDSEHQKANELQTGFIAEEVEQAAQSLGYDFHGVDTPKNENDHYGLRYAEFVVPLVKAVQEQQQLIEQQQKQAGQQSTEIAALKQLVNHQQKEIDELRWEIYLLLNKKK